MNTFHESNAFDGKMSKKIEKGD